ncbi:alpha/beta fold hydrolase [Filimonas effusa]|uniref:Proline iminopeptidase n=1 Tax=Filimonas effusa TaxID=2508721 RepID=A0A4Q1DBB9_9BACT|nr:alpha/beta fold hydrolase [Filimonas effusa]RXK86075.1 alpha/beta fold hydrolase [Filimonas effusa]
MKATCFISLLMWLLAGQHAFSQKYNVTIEPFPGIVKADPRLILKTGYLVVPESRQNPDGPKIKVPFLFVRRPGQDAQKNIILYSTGGPGYSTTAFIDSIAYNSAFLRYGGFIAFDQRGTKRAQPCLDCPEVNEALKRSYREQKNKDSLELIAITQCRQRLLQQNINLSAYNTIECAEDINDLRLALNIDSLVLAGISYSGGLMMTVARIHPEAVRMLFLNSPLPTFVNYEEHSFLNFNEALDNIFENVRRDSTATPVYGNLETRFHEYFTHITGKEFCLIYFDKEKKDSIRITYTKQELLATIANRMNAGQVRTVPFVISELISGHHKNYVTEILDEQFSGDKQLSLGMRYSFYCSEQIQYTNPRLEQQQFNLLPWFSGSKFNNVDQPACNCWQVTPEPNTTKEPLYSNIPAIISAGDIDPWCRPFYNRLIKRYMPNSQLLTIHDRGHAPGYTVDKVDYLDLFMKDPYKKLTPQSKNIIIE